MTDRSLEYHEYLEISLAANRRNLARLPAVIAVVPLSENVQKEVQLGGSENGDGCRLTTAEHLVSHPVNLPDFLTCDMNPRNLEKKRKHPEGRLPSVKAGLSASASDPDWSVRMHGL